MFRLLSFVAELLSNLDRMAALRTHPRGQFGGRSPVWKSPPLLPGVNTRTVVHTDAGKSG